MKDTFNTVRQLVSNMMHSALDLNLGETDTKDHVTNIMDNGGDIIAAMKAAEDGGAGAPKAQAVQNQEAPHLAQAAAVGDQVTVSRAKLDQLLNMSRRAVRYGKTGEVLSLPQRQFLRDAMRQIKADYIPGYRYKAPQGIERHRGQNKG